MISAFAVAFDSHVATVGFPATTPGNSFAIVGTFASTSSREYLAGIV